MNYEEGVVKKIYLDLDSFLDTRFGYLFSNSKYSLDLVTNSGYYKERLVDEFGDITYDMFNILFSNRDNSWLEYALPTKITDSIINDLSILKSNKYLSDDVQPYTITINAFPYKLSDSRIKLLKASFLNKLASSNVIVEVIEENPLSFDLDTLNNTYFSMYMYNGLEFLEYMMSFDSKKNIPNVKLVVPALISRILILTTEEFNETIKSTKQLLEPYVNLEFLPVSYFSYRNINIDT